MAFVKMSADISSEVNSSSIILRDEWEIGTAIMAVCGANTHKVSKTRTEKQHIASL
jgi:hypothetical protein